MAVGVDAQYNGVTDSTGVKTSHPEFEVGDPSANYPSDFVVFQNFTDQIACIRYTMQKNAMAMLAEMAIGDKLRMIHHRQHGSADLL